MDWSGEGIVLGARHHGETSSILELLTEDRGRHLGLVRGGRSRRIKAALQPGNRLSVVWRARLEDHLGAYSIEPIEQRAARLMGSRVGLDGLNLLTALCLLLPEREAHPRLYRALDAILAVLPDVPEVAAAIVRFELAFLEDLGFGLDLSACAATGDTHELVYVSPKSGRAVSRRAGAPYADRMLPLPDILYDGTAVPAGNKVSIASGFRLTGYFLDRHVFGPRGLTPPECRARLIAALVRRAADAS